MTLQSVPSLTELCESCLLQVMILLVECIIYRRTEASPNRMVRGVMRIVFLPIVKALGHSQGQSQGYGPGSLSRLFTTTLEETGIYRGGNYYPFTACCFRLRSVNL